VRELRTDAGRDHRRGETECSHAVRQPQGSHYWTKPLDSDIDLYVARTSPSVNRQTGSRLDPAVAVKNPSKTAIMRFCACTRFGPAANQRWAESHISHFHSKLGLVYTSSGIRDVRLRVPSSFSNISLTEGSSALYSI
jgi:hypothetical protein